MPVKTNRYYNDPSLGASFENLASMFINSPQDTLAMANARAITDKAARLSDLYSMAGQPEFNKDAFDRKNQAAGNWTPSQGYYGADTTADTARRGQDVTAATDIAKARMGEDASTFRTLMTPISKDAYRPALPAAVAGKYGLPTDPQYGVLEAGRGSTIVTPDGRTIQGQPVPMTREEIAGTVLQNELPNMSPQQKTQLALGQKPTEVGQMLTEKNALPPDSADRTVYDRALAAKSRMPYEGTTEKAIADLGTQIFSNAQKSATDRQTLATMQEAIDNPNVDQGSLGHAALGARKMLNALGFDAGSTSDAEVLNALGSQLALQLRDPSKGGGMPGSLSDADRQYLANMTVSLGNSPEANRKLLSQYLKFANRDQDLEALREQYVQQHGGLDEGFRTVMNGYLNGQVPVPRGAPAQAAQQDTAAASPGGMPMAQAGVPATAPAAQAPQTAPVPRAGDVLDGYRFRGGNPADPGSWERVN